MGYFRDDAPLCELMLDDAQQAELARLWDELNYIATVPFRQFRQFVHERIAVTRQGTAMPASRPAARSGQMLVLFAFFLTVMVGVFRWEPRCSTRLVSTATEQLASSVRTSKASVA